MPGRQSAQGMKRVRGVDVPYFGPTVSVCVGLIVVGCALTAVAVYFAYSFERSQGVDKVRIVLWFERSSAGASRGTRAWICLHLSVCCLRVRRGRGAAATSVCACESFDCVVVDAVVGRGLLAA